MRNGFVILIVVFILTSCSQKEPEKFDTVESWKLGWRMIESMMNDNYELASLQFDTLSSVTTNIRYKYLVAGIEAKDRLGKRDEVISLLSAQDDMVLYRLCAKASLAQYKVCEGLKSEKIENKTLQLELIKMYINDQYVRSNLMTDMLDKYGLEKEQVVEDEYGVDTDSKNRASLKDIIEKYGFPTKKLVGEDAMAGVFYIIQHADGDKEWQKSQLVNVEAAVKNGDMKANDYTYLYDRIKVNEGKLQRYGTQFSNVDLVAQRVELAPVEDEENLDRRRMEIDMMPIDMYKRFMLKLTPNPK